MSDRAYRATQKNAYPIHIKNSSMSIKVMIMNRYKFLIVADLLELSDWAHHFSQRTVLISVGSDSRKKKIGPISVYPIHLETF